MPPSKPGPKSRKNKTGEEWKVFKCNITPAQHEFIMNQGVLSAAQYVRYLIDMAMLFNEVPETLEEYGLSAEYVEEVLPINETFLAKIRKKILEGN